MPAPDQLLDLGLEPVRENVPLLAMIRKILALVVVAILVVPVISATATETDQFTGRLQSISDSTDILNAKVNETLTEIVSNWDAGEDRMAVVNSIYGKIGGRSIVDKLERWVLDNPNVDKHDTTRPSSIYGGLPFWSTRLIFLFEFGRTIRVNDQLLGTDKLSHFISQGRKFYKRYTRHGSEQKAVKRAVFAERGIFGSLTTGSFSNADLVSNYEGYRFYRSLFENDIVADKPAILRWTGDGWVIQREFDWSDHVNEYWDEALNINHYDYFLRKRMLNRLRKFCPQYINAPSLYAIANEDDLALRYSTIGLRDTSAFRLSAICFDSSTPANRKNSN